MCPADLVFPYVLFVNSALCITLIRKQRGLLLFFGKHSFLRFLICFVGDVFYFGRKYARCPFGIGHNWIYWRNISSKFRTMRVFSHLRLLILLTVALNTLDHKLQQRGQLNLTKFQEDLRFCPQCFESQKVACGHLMENLIANTNHKPILEHLFALLPQRSCKRNNQLYGLKGQEGETNTHQILAKYFANSKEHLEWKLQVGELKQLFLDAERLDGMQFWPLANIEDFMKLLMEYHRNLSPLAI
ncbi:uncharacterized protein LOC101900446 isoform X1 [Musca domestica]|uniref:Uncharacterized protein LOC101900446 isoform X1 n=1 Tax=Musca domestica TaxID=7370 RepID=A0ABM3VGQ5_MUSDO|nr:uncharacterized protein LOC101900446 isoform X1 [Musca domestica]